MEMVKEYVAHLDNKKRITLRGAVYQYYIVKERELLRLIEVGASRKLLASL